MKAFLWLLLLQGCSAFLSPMVSPKVKVASGSKLARGPLKMSLQPAVLPPPIYDKGFDSESPKVLGGIKIGLRKLVVITGASSGLGRECARALCKTGNYFVVMACRDVEKVRFFSCIFAPFLCRSAAVSVDSLYGACSRSFYYSFSAASARWHLF